MPKPLKRKVAPSAAGKTVAPKAAASKRSNRPKVDRSEITKAYEQRDQTGKYKSYIKPEFQSMLWKPKSEETHVISILPTFEPKEDRWTFFHIVYYHGGVGINEDNYLCNARMFDKKCYICEAKARYIMECERKGEEPDDDRMRALSPSKKVLYNVRVVTDQKTEDEGNKIFEAPGKKIHSAVLGLCVNKRTGAVVSLTDIEDGRDVQFTKEGKGLKTDYVGVQLLERDPIPEEWQDDLVELANCYHIPTYDEVKNVFCGEVEEDDEDVAVVPEDDEEEVGEDVGDGDVEGEYAAAGDEDYEEEVVEEQEPPRRGRSRGAPVEAPAPQQATAGRKSFRRSRA